MPSHLCTWLRTQSCGEETKGKPLADSPVNLSHLFDLSLQGRRNVSALEFQAQTYTFGELDSRSNRVAQLLLQSGFQAGDRLCVYLPNCVEIIDLYLACVKSGIIFVPVNILYRDREILHI